MSRPRHRRRSRDEAQWGRWLHVRNGVPQPRRSRRTPKLRFAGYTTDVNAGDLVNQMGLIEYNDFEDAAFGSGLTSGYNDDNLGWHEGYGRAYFSGQTKSEFLFEIEIRE
jgi:hypothetical protein